jgi:hypothetical protein
MVPVTISGTMTDNLSGIDPSTAAFSVADEYGSVQPSGPLSLAANGTYSFIVLLEASREGTDKDGRQYTISVSASDLAGNMGSAATLVVVPHDQGHNGPSATATTLASSPNPSSVGQPVTLTATVAAMSGSPSATGTVTFEDASAILGTSALNGSGVATYTTSSLAVRQHSVSAAYNGDANNASSMSTVLTQTVNAAEFGLSSSPSSATLAAGQSSVFTLTVTSQGSFTSPISFSCNGLPALASCAFSPAAVTPNSGAVTATLTIGTAARTAFLTPPAFSYQPSPLYASWLTLLAMLLTTVALIKLKRGKLQGYILVGLMAGGCLLQAACGGGSPTNNVPSVPTAAGGTPAGMYTVSVVATAGSMQHSTTLTLTVQ